MKCMYCGAIDTKVIDSRASEDGNTVRRRRECITCGKRFTTYEKVEITPVLVVKNNGNRQQFDSSKIKNGILKACEKRPVSAITIDKIVNSIEKRISNTLAQEISSQKIGDMVMAMLKEVDDVAYVRFASVHREFKDINTFLEEINSLVKGKQLDQ